jgi:mRNA-degrading endonuclease YafQ of YafQ-DinJ toxin-antitoxin module
MSEYIAKYEKQFTRNLKRYRSLKQRIKRCVDRVIDDPYSHTEFLGDISGKLNLKGCRSARIDREAERGQTLIIIISLTSRNRLYKF